jgi:hypothetical protein
LVFTAGKGRWGITADIDYAALGSDENPRVGVIFDDVKVKTDITMVNVKGLYRVAETPNGFGNLTGGLRWYDLSLKTEFRSTRVLNRNISQSDSWADLTLGVSGYTQLSQDWFLAGFLDIGGFGIGDSSDLSWQAFGAVGYRFNETWSAELGYRYLSIEREIDNSDVTLDMYGPVIGVMPRCRPRSACAAPRPLRGGRSDPRRGLCIRLFPAIEDVRAWCWLRRLP